MSTGMATGMATGMTDLQQYAFYNFYSSLTEDGAHKQTLQEAAHSAVDILQMLSGDKLSPELVVELTEAIATLQALPSMRLFSSNKKAIKRDNSIIYNCLFIGIDSLKSFADIVYASMSGVGVGYSIENKFTKSLPSVPYVDTVLDEIYTITDSQEGWADSVLELLNNYFYSQSLTTFDYSLVRPSGAILHTKGGLASGPEPLYDLHNHIYSVLDNAQGRRLRSIEVMSIVNYIATTVISGGSRRSALICLFDLDDEEMLTAKDGDYYSDPNRKHYANSNNSAVIERWMTHKEISDLFSYIFSPAGEPGFWSRIATRDNAPYGRVLDQFSGTNPCSEITLRNKQFCNLSVAVISANDERDIIRNKFRLATIMGTIQSMATHFPFLGEPYSTNGKEERLLGVSPTGAMDNPLMVDADFLDELRQLVIDTNIEYADAFGINHSAATTTVKPSGNSSVLTNTSPGLHYPLALYGVRNVTLNAGSPMIDFLEAQNALIIDHPYRDYGDKLATIPFIAQNTNVDTIYDVSAIQQLENYLLYSQNFSEHSVSVTISYREEETQDIIDWVYAHQEDIKSLSFLPVFLGEHPYLPIQSMSKEDYDEFMLTYQPLDWSTIDQYYSGHFSRATVKVLECSGDSGSCIIGGM